MRTPSLVSAMGLGRALDGGNYFEDNGSAYGLSWRYLGLFMDCDVEAVEQRRRLDDNNDCSRKVLWAAYRDPSYSGGSIGEYAYYDWEQQIWDESTCHTERCAKMNCHEKESEFELIGVFKETDGLEDWAEQLFKHQGYCLWDGDKQDDAQDNADSGDENYEVSDYEFMQTEREEWSAECTSLGYTDQNGLPLYTGIQPLAAGEMAFGLFTDAYCSHPSEYHEYQDYLRVYYTSSGYSETDTEALIANYEATVARWNRLLNPYKVCQPCSAYNKVVVANDERRRELNDGEGDSEQWGYNCYDDAGYTNCNQCYKFETQTDMEMATTQDLERASSQGSILAIEVDGKWYGKGGFETESDGSILRYVIAFGTVACIFWLGLLCYARKLIYKRAMRLIRKVRPPSLRESLSPSDKDSYSTGSGTADSSDSSLQDSTDRYHAVVEEFLDDESVDTTTRDKAAAVFQSADSKMSNQENDIAQLKFTIDMERTMHDLERSRLKEYAASLERQLKSNVSNKG